MSNVKDIKRKAVKITLTDGVERTLKFTLNALAELEMKFGSVDKAFEKLDENSMVALRAVLWAGFLHESPDLKEREVGDLIDLEYMKELVDTLGKAFDGDMPEVNDEETEEVEAKVIEDTEDNKDPNM